MRRYFSREALVAVVTINNLKISTLRVRFVGHISSILKNKKEHSKKLVPIAEKYRNASGKSIDFFNIFYFFGRGIRRAKFSSILVSEYLEFSPKIRTLNAVFFSYTKKREKV